MIVVVKNEDAAFLTIPNYPLSGSSSGSGPNSTTTSASAPPSNVCHVCNKTFTDSKRTRMHMIAAHMRRKGRSDSCAFPCTFCNAHTAFKTRRELNAHKHACHRKSTHKAKKTHMCTHCGEKFVYKYELHAHMDTHFMYTRKSAHELVCALCGLHVASLPALKIHAHRFHPHGKNVHGKNEQEKNAHECTQPQFLCAFCGELTHTRKEFLAHTRTHTQEERRNSHTDLEKTVTCARMDSQNAYMGQEAHTETYAYMEDPNTCMNPMETHTDQQNTYMSPEKTHTDQQNTYMSPENTHTGPQNVYMSPEKMHTGPQNAYMNSENTHTDPQNAYMNPENTHTDPESAYMNPEKTHMDPHNTAHTPQESAHIGTPSQTKAHMTQRKTVTCVYCGKSMLASSLSVHVRRIHTQKTILCAYCDQKFHVRSDLMRHVNLYHCVRKSYTCSLCAHAFTTSDALRYHRNKTHSTETHTCAYCPKTYSWKGELRTHILRAHRDAHQKLEELHMETKHEQKQQEEEEGQQQIPPPPPPPPPPFLCNPPSQEEEEEEQEEEVISNVISSEIYLVPNLSVPLHEEQVSTS